MIVVSDTTPLITLIKASLLDVLRYLYNEIQIPDAVYAELSASNEYQDEVEIIKSSPFIKVVSVENNNSVRRLKELTGLDLGESEAIIYAEENNADTLLMDENAGRKIAKSMGIHIMGSIGIIIAAYDMGIINADDVRMSVEKIKEANRWISNTLLQYTLDYVNKNASS